METVKIFSLKMCSDSDFYKRMGAFEDHIVRWLATNPRIEIVSRQMASAASYSVLDGNTLFLTVTIFYKPAS